jgi:hypothetical protein
MILDPQVQIWTQDFQSTNANHTTQIFGLSLISHVTRTIRKEGVKQKSRINLQREALDCNFLPTIGVAI